MNSVIRRLDKRGKSLDKKRKDRNLNVEIPNYAKAFDCVDHNKLWKILKEMGIPDHLTCPSQKRQSAELKAANP